MKILVAMSGGVDSSVAAAILKHQGHEVMGVHMRVHVEEESCRALPRRIGNGSKPVTKSCCSPLDALDASDVAHQLDIPFISIGFENSFRRDVIEPFISDYKNGRTPSPCVNCNNHVKLGELLRRAGILGYDYVATGHYARVEGDRLFTGVDGLKDQSYYLAGLSRNQLSRLITPLGDYTKTEIREYARHLGLCNADKPDSMDICFAPNGYREFLKKEGVEDKRGDFVDRYGEKIGEHDGVHHYTIGQRVGRLDAYVTKIIASENRIVLGALGDIRKISIRCSRFNELRYWGENEDGLKCKLRARGDFYSVYSYLKHETHGEIHFNEFVPLHASGQLAVVYHNNEVVASGVIENE